MKHLVVLFGSIIFFGCVENNNKNLDVQEIIDQSIEVSGGDKFNNSLIDFDFRDKHYSSSRYNGFYELTREFKDSIGIIKDYLGNKGFQRYLNNKKIVVHDSMIPKYSASVNSVHYFSTLPYGLNDEAVNKELLEEVFIKNSTYFKIKVTFNQEGGGEDFEDVFVYWINKETYKVDYLAYSYQEPEGIGLRFREAYNERYVNELRFVDYKNYKPNKSDITVFELDDLFKKGQLKLLSKIELKNITVD